MASKATTKRQRSSQKVAAAGRTHKSRVVASVGNLLDDECAAAVDLLIERTVSMLNRKTETMVAADDAHEAELRDDPEAREQRDRGQEIVRDRLVNTREKLGALYGGTYLAKLGFSGSTPTDPTELLRLGKTILGNLSVVTPPAPMIPGYQFDATHWTGDLADAIQGLETAISQVSTEEREAESTLADKNKAIADYDAAFSCTANLVSTLLEVAGEKELARRVRPSTRRTGQTVEDAGEDGTTPATP